MRHLLYTFAICVTHSAHAQDAGATDTIRDDGASARDCTLWVDGSIGNDSTNKASNTAETPWNTLLRATWGNTNRASAGTRGEAAAAGDVVCVAGGAYDSAADCLVGGVQQWGTCRFEALYETVNSGSVDNPIRFVCTGDCTLTCPDCQAPALGGTSDFVEWYADISDGASWIIPACYGRNGAGDTCPGSGFHEFRADTGPITAGGKGIKFEGIVLTLTNEGSDDNAPAVRFQGCDGCEIRNSTIDRFKMAGGGNHAPCFQIYHSVNSVIEHNECTNGSAGFSFKDQTAMTGTDNLIRFNWFENLYECGHWSVIQNTSDYGGTYVYQNVFKNTTGPYCANVIETEGGAQGFVNNVIYGANVALCGSCGGTDVFRSWNNVVKKVAFGIFAEGALPTDDTHSFQHNAYDDYSDDFFGSEKGGNRGTLAAFVRAHTTQETESPVGIDADPRFANIAGDDFRLCTGRGIPHTSCSGPSPALALGLDFLDLDGDKNTSDNIPAGAYVTGSEVIGLDP